MMNIMILPQTLILLCDATQFGISNVLKAIGFGSWTVKVFILSYYIIGSISCILLVYVANLKLLGAWLAFDLSLVIIVMFYLYKYNTIDLK
jgi:Na+-driven multidrug efflux pump